MLPYLGKSCIKYIELQKEYEIEKSFGIIHLDDKAFGVFRQLIF